MLRSLRSPRLPIIPRYYLLRPLYRSQAALQIPQALKSLQHHQVGNSHQALRQELELPQAPWLYLYHWLRGFYSKDGKRRNQNLQWCTLATRGVPSQSFLRQKCRPMYTSTRCRPGKRTANCLNKEACLRRIVTSKRRGFCQQHIKKGCEMQVLDFGSYWQV